MYLTLFTGVAVLAAVYYASHVREWDSTRQVVLASGFLLFAGAFYAFDWLSRKRARQ